MNILVLDRRHPPSRARGAGLALVVGLPLVGLPLVAPLAPAAVGDTTATTERVSVAGAGREGGRQSGAASVSRGGRYVAFTSSSRFVRGDTNGTADVYVRDRRERVTRLVSTTPSGTAGNGGSFLPTVTPDGRFVAFLSIASDLAPGDGDTASDVFVRDLVAGTTRRVSVADDGSESATWVTTSRPDLSADGRLVTFTSTDATLAPGGTSGVAAVYLRDRVRGTTERVSVDSAGSPADGDSADATISSDGRLVAFSSYAGDLVPGDTGPYADVFLRDRAAGTTTRLSTGVAGAQPDGGSVEPDVSAGGAVVAFRSQASNLVPRDTNAADDVFVADLAAGTVRRVSLSSSEGQAGAGSVLPSTSGSGRFVAFQSVADDLVAGDTNDATDVFVRDRLLGTIRRVSVSAAGGQGGGSSGSPALSTNGRHVAFESEAADLVPRDTNQTIDVFLRVRFAG